MQLINDFQSFSAHITWRFLLSLHKAYQLLSERNLVKPTYVY